jgi:hypothetical protein
MVHMLTSVLGPTCVVLRIYYLSIRLQVDAMPIFPFVKYAFIHSFIPQYHIDWYKHEWNRVQE